ncbi:hypothetical protein [Mycobacterium timonense]|uniref:hypothetical protein n=1 Tax=Mycobacterium timonense TaxID=701043 RepID=UPI001154B5AD|nr:hypothetical protein [Mycobacterium timonense]
MSGSHTLPTQVSLEAGHDNETRRERIVVTDIAGLQQALDLYGAAVYWSGRSTGSANACVDFAAAQSLAASLREHAVAARGADCHLEFILVDVGNDFHNCTVSELCNGDRLRRCPVGNNGARQLFCHWFNLPVFAILSLDYGLVLGNAEELVRIGERGGDRIRDHVDQAWIFAPLGRFPHQHLGPVLVLDVDAALI